MLAVAILQDIAAASQFDEQTLISEALMRATAA
jgi:hypothetical protein